MATCLPNVARARGETVALASPKAADDVVSEITTRLRAELEAAGFDVEELGTEPNADPEQPVSTTGLPRAPRATVAVTGEDGVASVDIWFSDPKTRELAVRHVETPPVARQRAASVLAVRTVELLRATLLGPGASPAPPAPRAAPTPDVAAAREQRRLRLGGEVGAAMLSGGRGISASFAPLLRFQIGARTWGGRANVIAPAYGGEASASGGKATLRQEQLSLDATATWPAEGPISFVGSAGGGVYHWHVGGEAVAPNVGHDAERWGAVADVGAGASLRFGAHVGLLLDAHALWLAPPLIVRVVGAEAGQSGQPMLCATLGLWAAQ